MIKEEVNMAVFILSILSTFFFVVTYGFCPKPEENGCCYGQYKEGNKCYNCKPGTFGSKCENLCPIDTCGISCSQSCKCHPKLQHCDSALCCINISLSEVNSQTVSLKQKADCKPGTFGSNCENLCPIETCGISCSRSYQCRPYLQRCDSALCCINISLSEVNSNTISLPGKQKADEDNNSTHSDKDGPGSCMQMTVIASFVAVAMLVIVAFLLKIIHDLKMKVKQNSPISTADAGTDAEWLLIQEDTYSTLQTERNDAMLMTSNENENDLSTESTPCEYSSMTETVLGDHEYAELSENRFL